MTAVVDTSVLVDHLRGVAGATDVLTRSRAAGPLWASEVVRLAILAGMRPREGERTEALLSVLSWRPLDEAVARTAGELGRAWLPSHSGIEAADLAVAATATLLRAPLLTTNIRHFPMFADLQRPY